MTSISKLSSPLFIATGLIAIAYAGTCLALYNAQTQLIFRPLPFLLRTPDEVGLAYEDVWIPLSPNASDKAKLHGWWMPNHSSRIFPAENRTLLLCHGNYGNVSYNVNRCRFYHSLGFSVLSFDYRGFGLSPSNDPSEQKTYEDAEAALSYLIQERQIAPNKITILGHSLGGAIALNLATHHPEIHSLIVESSFTSMKAAVHAKKIYRLFPIEQLLSHAFDSLFKVQDLKVPVLYAHGDNDRDVPSEFSQQLYQASSDPKHLWIAPEGGHDNLPTNFSDGYAKAIQSFFQKTAKEVEAPNETSKTVARASK